MNKTLLSPPETLVPLRQWLEFNPSSAQTNEFITACFYATLLSILHPVDGFTSSRNSL
jgi:hypothetical protein